MSNPRSQRSSRKLKDASTGLKEYSGPKMLEDNLRKQDQSNDGDFEIPSAGIIKPPEIFHDVDMDSISGENN
jgi:hypothetical protein